MSKSVILIPSRLSATRLPGKPLLKINGISIISHVVKKAKEADIGKVYVATEDKEILDDVNFNGGKAILTNNKHKTGSDRIFECFEKLDLISKSLDFQKFGNKDSISFYDSKLVSVNKRQFLHNANFAMRYSNYEIAPYIAITDLRESSAILDTIYKSLGNGIKNSKYALELKNLIN